LLVLWCLRLHLITGHPNFQFPKLRKIFVHLVGYVPVVTYWEDVTCSEKVPTDFVHRNAAEKMSSALLWDLT
jgi:hypothetical protein